MEVFLQLRLQVPFGYGLGDTVRNSGNSQLPLPAPALVDLHSLHGRWKVAAGRHPIPELVEIVFQIPVKLLDRRKGSSIHILPRLIWAGDAVCCGKWPWTESTMKTQSELTGREQQYLGHLRGAQARQLTLAQYCRAQGLSAQSLYRVSHRLARKGILWHREEVAKKPQPAGKFLAVRVAAPAAVGTVCRLQHPNGWVMECASWPEASWLSQFVTGGSHSTP